jgi:predicted phosphodiesterase
MVRRRRDFKNTGIFSRFFRSVISIVILSGFVLGVSLFVKQLATMDTDKLARVFSSVLAKANIDIDEDRVGEVAGKFAERFSDTDLSGVFPDVENPKDLQDLADSGDSFEESPSVETRDSEEGSSERSVGEVRVAVMADIHGDAANLKKALYKAESENVNAVFILGDLTDYGTIEDLRRMEGVLDSFDLDYYAIPGDHDLAASLDATNFIKIFDTNDYLVTIEDYTFLAFDNSANYTRMTSERMSWFGDMVKEADFVLLSQPVFTDGLSAPFKDMFMGHSREEPEGDLKALQDGVREQRDEILESIRDEDVGVVFAGDHHRSSYTKDSVDGDLGHYMVGAITDAVYEIPQKILQSMGATARFSLLVIDDSGDVKVSEITLD